MVIVLLIILGIILFQLLVILHEYGHFLVAKRNGVEVEEFGLGFPPRIVGKVMGKGIFRGLYTLNWLPLGGFVRLKGENDSAKGEGTYGGSSLRVKAKIILAGVAVNYLIAVVLFTVLAAVGVPRLLPLEPITSEEQFAIASDTHIVSEKTYISYVAPGSPAEAAGIEQGDRIVTIGDREIGTFEALGEATQNYAGQEVQIVVERDRQSIELQTTLNSSQTVDESRAAYEACIESPDTTECEEPKAYLGVVSEDLILQRNTWSAPIVGVGLSVQYTKVTFQGLWRAISSLFKGDTQTAKDSVAGPVGVFFVIKQGANLGIRFLLMIIAILSLTLAIMNSLPIPALDGGRLMLTVLFRKVLKKPLTKDIEERIVGTSMAMLLLLMALITVVDVQRFF